MYVGKNTFYGIQTECITQESGLTVVKDYATIFD